MDFSGKRMIGLVFLMSVALLSLAACAPAEPPPLVSLEAACAPENDGKPMAVAGYFQLSSMVFCTDSCTLGFSDTAEGESRLSPDVKVGTGTNQMRELPDDFTAEDFQVTAQNGTVIGLGDRVQISGKMGVAPNVCLMYVEQIVPAA